MNELNFVVDNPRDHTNVADSCAGTGMTFEENQVAGLSGIRVNGPTNRALCRA